MELYVVIAWMSMVVGSLGIAVTLLVVTRHLRGRLRDKKWSGYKELRGKFGILYGIQLLFIACALVSAVVTFMYWEGESNSDILSSTFILTLAAIGVGIWCAVSNLLPIIDALRDDGQ